MFLQGHHNIALSYPEHNQLCSDGYHLKRIGNIVATLSYVRNCVHNKAQKQLFGCLPRPTQTFGKLFIFFVIIILHFLCTSCLTKYCISLKNVLSLFSKPRVHRFSTVEYCVNLYKLLAADRKHLYTTLEGPRTVNGQNHV